MREQNSGKKAGEWVFLEDVQKSGYELVNKKDIEQVKLSADEPNH